MARSRQRGGAAIPASALLAIAGALAIGLATWGPTRTSAASPAAPAASASLTDAPPGTLQDLIDAASPGAVVNVPPAIYREQVSIDHPLTLRGEGAEIRGADVWTDWQADGADWLSDRAVPAFTGGGECIEARCAWPEQVFVDGEPLLQVARNPAAGEFAIGPERRVVLADDPAGHVVEVTVRERWLTVDAPDVTIEGLAMSEAASPPQHGALQALPGADRLTVTGVRLSDAHGALISFQGVTGASLISSDLSRGGQLGVHAGGEGTSDLTIEGNRIADNNTEGFDPAWEAGGLKAAVSTGLRVTDNDVAENDGVGIWCDIDCRDFAASGNRVHGNSRAGIMFEISDGARIENNVVWENGWGFPTWGWGAGILVSSSSDATVRGNLLAWNADGISVISQDRNQAGGDAVRNVSVTGNTVLADAASGFLLAWLQDWSGPLYAADSGNAGSGNRFWHETPEPSSCRFDWASCIDAIGPFSTTPGGKGSTYLTDAAAHAALTRAGVPAHPVPHPFGEPPRLRDVAIAAGVAGLAVLALIVGAVLVIRRRRRIRRSSRDSG
jgi:nitrous oxidase accessory protein NosD